MWIEFFFEYLDEFSASTIDHEKDVGEVHSNNYIISIKLFQSQFKKCWYVILKYYYKVVLIPIQKMLICDIKTLQIVLEKFKFWVFFLDIIFIF